MYRNCISCLDFYYKKELHIIYSIFISLGISTIIYYLTDNNWVVSNRFRLPIILFFIVMLIALIFEFCDCFKFKVNYYEIDDAFERKFLVKNVYRHSQNTNANESLNYAIIGRWGSGKSYFLKFFIQELKESNIKSNANIIVDLTDINLGIIKDPVKTILDSFDSKSQLGLLIADLKGLFYSDNEFFLSKFIVYFLPSFKLSEREIKSKLQQHLINKHVYIILDDMDRMNQDEILSVFSLMKSLLNYKNIHFVVGVDMVSLSGILKDIPQLGELNSENSIDKVYEYISKYFQILIHLPDNDFLGAYFNNKLKEIFGLGYFDDNTLNILMEHKIGKLLSTPRDINSVLTMTRLLCLDHDQYFDLTILIFLETLKIKKPISYKTLRELSRDNHVSYNLERTDDEYANLLIDFSIFKGNDITSPIYYDYLFNYKLGEKLPNYDMLLSAMNDSSKLSEYRKKFDANNFFIVLYKFVKENLISLNEGTLPKILNLYTDCYSLSYFSEILIHLNQIEENELLQNCLHDIKLNYLYEYYIYAKSEIEILLNKFEELFIKLIDEHGSTYNRYLYGFMFQCAAISSNLEKLKGGDHQKLVDKINQCFKSKFVDKPQYLLFNIIVPTSIQDKFIIFNNIVPSIISVNDCIASINNSLENLYSIQQLAEMSTFMEFLGDVDSNNPFIDFPFSTFSFEYN